MGNEANVPVALFGFSKGAAWVADDVFVTRCAGGGLLVERWASSGVRSAVVDAGSRGFMAAIWLKLNERAFDGTIPFPDRQGSEG